MSVYTADTHTHSRCSPDAAYPMAEMAEAAAAAGLDEICFTDHVDLRPWRDYVPPERYPWERLVDEVREARERWGDRITIRLGAEMGEMYTDFPKAERYWRDRPELDFVIGSIHVMGEQYDHLDFTHIDQVAERYDEVIEDYLAQQMRHIGWGHFSVMGHLTLPLRYANERFQMGVTFEKHMDSVEQVLRALIEKGLGLECNTNRGRSPLTGAEILRLYRRLGGEIVTLGSDAHRPEHVGLGIREGQALLRECGFRYFCTFRQMRPEFHPL